MVESNPDRELARLWEEWVAARNLRGLRIASILAVILYPLFWILDYQTIDSALMADFTLLRLFIVVYAGVMLLTSRFAFARRIHYFLSGLTTAVFAYDILAMVVLLGGIDSSYYAGINLVMLGTGLLFLYPLRKAVVVYGTILVSWVVVGALMSRPGIDLATALGNSFFLAGTAILVVVGQYFGYRTQYRQVRDNRALELTKGSLEKAHENLKQLDHFKSQFFANITHELKTPLQMILGPLDLFLDRDVGRLSEDQRATFQSMYRNATKLLQMIGDILDLSKLEESRLRLRIEEHDLVDYLRGLVAQVRPLTQRKEIELTFESDREVVQVWYDTERLERVFVNLLSNAAKFTPSGGHVRVSVADRDGSVRISVADDGPGFPPEMATRVFERFFQVDMGATRKHGGTGIGLALAKELVELHGGTIRAESDVGKGATFIVDLVKGREHFAAEVLERRKEVRDVSESRREQDRGIEGWPSRLTNRADFRLLSIAEATDRRVVARDPEEGHKRYTVLAVDDTPDVLRIVSATLQQSFRVLAAEDGPTALRLVEREVPHLILTDLMMPGMDGLELTRRLREDPRTRHVPIVMLTARGDVEDRVAGLQGGVNAYMAKPFSPKELLTLVRGQLDIQETTADLVLARRMDSLEIMASGVAHEVNNAVNPVKGALEVLGRDTIELVGLLGTASDRALTPEETARIAKLESRMQRMFRTAASSVERITNTVVMMREYCREGYTRVLRPHDVYEAAREAIRLLVSGLDRDVTVRTEFEGNGSIECMPEEFHQVLTNLIQNAIEAAPDPGGEVVVSGRERGVMLVLSVRDNGPGIPPEVKERIFTPFFSTKGPGRGMGLGLTIAWRVVKSLGGTIEVRGGPGSGTEFVVAVPREQPRPVAGQGVTA